MKKRIILIVASAAVLGAAGVSAGTFWYLDRDPDPVVTVAAPSTPAPAPAPPPPAPLGSPLVPGMYNFAIKGGQHHAGDPAGVRGRLPGAQSGTVGGQSQRVPQEIRLAGTRYTGQSMSERGIVCVSDSQAHAAETSYSVDSDGTDGLVEVLGQPCGPGAPNVPLAFNLTLVPSP